jgi:dTDP-4-dehydrorhamnose reductase
MRIGVTGLTGYLGDRVGRAVRHAGHEVVDLGRGAGVELLEPATLTAALTRLCPQAVIHTAAANPGRPPETMDPVNRIATAALAGECHALGVRLVHVSTDVVFDGRRAPYADDAPPSPLNEYGRTKAAAERAVQRACPTAAIVRTSLIYGVHDVDRSTAGFIHRLEAGGRLALFSDVVRQPVFVDALAGSLVRLATDLGSVAGTLNVAGEQPMDRATFGRRMLAFWAIDPAAHGGGIDEVAAATVADDIPRDLRLGLGRARALGLACPGVDEVLGTQRR